MLSSPSYLGRFWSWELATRRLTVQHQRFAAEPKRSSSFSDVVSPTSVLFPRRWDHFSVKEPYPLGLPYIYRNLHLYRKGHFFTYICILMVVPLFSVVVFSVFHFSTSKSFSFLNFYSIFTKFCSRLQVGVCHSEIFSAEPIFVCIGSSSFQGWLTVPNYPQKNLWNTLFKAKKLLSCFFAHFSYRNRFWKTADLLHYSILNFT